LYFTALYLSIIASAYVLSVMTEAWTQKVRDKIAVWAAIA
jgi:hypothetical protein